MSFLGKLEEISVEEVWGAEKHGFSDWMANNENISLLNDVLGMNLNNVDKEIYVGEEHCGVVAEDETTKMKVLIENQLEISSYDYLGKIISYASCINANVIVWIVSKAKKEHKNAISWLNNNTGKNINFFLVEIHAYKIGNSLPAPKFELIEEPNKFIKNAKDKIIKEFNKLQSDRLEFWTIFNEILISKNKPFMPQKATSEYWYEVSLNSEEARINITLLNKDKVVGIELYINDNKELFDVLFDNQNEIETELGFKFLWQRLDDKKASRIRYYVDGLDFDNHSNYKELMENIISKVIAMKEVFSKYIIK